MRNIFVGKIINSFGLKGELKISSNFDIPQKVFIKNKKIIINNQSHIITSVRFHKNHYLITIDNLFDINLIEQFRNQDIYILYDELELNDEEYIIDELVGMKVYNDNLYYGEVTDVFKDAKNPLIKVNSHLIPLNSNYIIKIDTKNRQINTTDIKELEL